MSIIARQRTVAWLSVKDFCSHCVCFFFSSRRRHTRFDCDWSSDVCSSDLWREEPGATESTTEGRTSNTGSAQAYVPLPQSGSYPVTVLAQTPEGQEVRATPPSGSKAESEMCTAKRASASRSFPTRSPTAPAKSRVF